MPARSLPRRSQPWHRHLREPASRIRPSAAQPRTGCIFNGGGIQAYGRGGDGGQTLSQAITNLTFTYNTFENMTYGPNNFRTNGGIFIGGGSNNVVIRHNTFSNIMPYDDGYNAAGKTYEDKYDPDGDAARAAIWFYGGYKLFH